MWHTVAHKYYLNNILLVSKICKVIFHLLPPLILYNNPIGKLIFIILIVGASTAVHQTLPYLLLSGHMVRLLCILEVRGGHVTCSDQRSEQSDLCFFQMEAE